METEEKKHVGHCCCPECADKEAHTHREGSEHAHHESCGHAHHEHGEGAQIGCGCGCCDHESHYDRSKGKFANFIGEHWRTLLCVIVALAIGIVCKTVAMNETLAFILNIVAILVVGLEVVIDGVKNLFHGEFLNEDTLMIIAGVVAFIIGDAFEGILIISLFRIGEMLEDVATGNSLREVAGLMSLKSETAHLVREDGVTDVSPEEVPVGSLIRVLNGEKIPLDGEVAEGSSSLDTAALTGESRYREVEAGDAVVSGAINAGGVLVIRTTKPYSESTVKKILDLVSNAAQGKTKSERFITKFAKIYTPIVVALAVLIAVVPPLFDGMNFTKWIYSALSFLVVSCPCALVISVPLSFFISIGSLAKKGVLVKGSKYLENLANSDTILFDKTGTLTKGNFAVKAVVPMNGFAEDEVTALAASAERYSNHPLAKAISALSHQPVELTDVQEIAGKGVRAVAEGRELLVGSRKLLADYGISAAATEDASVYVAVDGVFAGYVEIRDEIKPTTKEALAALRRAGACKLVMLSGDNRRIAGEVAGALGLDGYEAELLPDAKVEAAEKYRKESAGKTVYVGDGINDAPVLALADVGVAMGGLGSDAAIESADAVIMNDDLTKLPLAIRAAKKARRIVTENIVFSLAVKVVIMALSLVIELPIWVALFGDVGVMLLAVLNSFRNYRIR